MGSIVQRIFMLLTSSTHNSVTIIFIELRYDTVFDCAIHGMPLSLIHTLLVNPVLPSDSIN